MAILNFPNTKLNGDPLEDGDLYTGDNEIVYRYDGVKWSGRKSVIIGDTGYTGSEGYWGSTGYTGSEGYWGSVGYTGSEGYWGSVGYTGSQGGNANTGDLLFTHTEMSASTNADVTLVTNANTWTFAADGTLTAPGHILPNTNLAYDLGSTTTQWRSIYVGTGTIYIGGVALGVNQYNYVTVDGNPIITINTAGNLTVQGDVNIGTVQISDTAPTATTGTQWFNTVEGRTYVATGGVWLDASPTQIPSPETYLDNIEIDGSTLYINSSTLTINTSGTLLVNGSEVTGSGGGGWQLTSSTAVVSLSSTGTLTLPDGGTISEVTVTPGGGGNPSVGILLTPFVSDEFGTPNPDMAVKIYPTFNDDDHIHIVAGNPTTVDLFLGDDDQYVKIEKNHGNIVVGTNTTVSNSTWTFGTDGVLTLSTASTILGNSTDPNVYIETATTSTTNTWTFAADGGLTFPDGTTSTGAVIRAAQSSSYIIQTLGSAEASPSNVLSTFEFGVAGTLTLPEGGVISEGGGFTGAIRLTPAGGANAYQALVIYPTAAAPDGDHLHLTAGGGTTELYLGNDYHYVKLVDGGNVEVQASTGTYSNGVLSASAWTFGKDGRLVNVDGLTLTAGGQFNICTIVSVGSGYNTGSALKATTGGSGTGMTVGIGYGLSNQLSNVTVVDPGTGYVDGDVITVSEGTDGTFILTQYNELGNQGNNNFVQSNWTFATDGILTVPANSSILTNETALKIATSPTTTYTFNQAYWEALNGNATRMFTPTGNAQYFSCTVTANQDGTYTVADPTGNSFAPGNWFKVPGNELGGATPANDIQINIATVDGAGVILTTTITGTAVGKQWQFSSTGTTTLPIGVTIDEYNGSHFPRIVADTGKAFSVQGQGSTGSVALQWAETASTSSQIAQVGLNKFGGIAAVTLTAGTSTNDMKVWKFAADGSTTFPDATVQTTAWTGTSTLVNGTSIVSLSSTGTLTVPSHIIPATDIAYDLGSPTNRFRDIYVSSNTIFIGSGTISISTTGQMLVNGNDAVSKLEYFGGAGFGPRDAGYIAWNTSTFIFNIPGKELLTAIYDLKAGSKIRAVNTSVSLDQEFTIVGNAREYIGTDGISSGTFQMVEIDVAETTSTNVYAYSLYLPVKDKSATLANGTWTIAVSTTGTVVFPDGSAQQGASISITALKILVAASTDFANFKSRIAEL